MSANIAGAGTESPTEVDRYDRRARQPDATEHRLDATRVLAHGLGDCYAVLGAAPPVVPPGRLAYVEHRDGGFAEIGHPVGDLAEFARLLVVVVEHEYDQIGALDGRARL